MPHEFRVPIKPTVRLSVGNKRENCFSFEMEDGEFIINDNRNIRIFKSTALRRIHHIIESEGDPSINGHIAGKSPLDPCEARTFIIRNPIEIRRLAFCSNVADCNERNNIV